MTNPNPPLATEPVWTDEQLRTHYHIAFGTFPDVHHWALLCWIRDDYQQEIDRLTAENASLRERVQWEPVGNGAVVGHNLSVESEPDGYWRLWIGGAAVVFPPTVRLQRRVPQETNDEG